MPEPIAWAGGRPIFPLPGRDLIMNFLGAVGLVIAGLMLLNMFMGGSPEERLLNLTSTIMGVLMPVMIGFSLPMMMVEMMMSMIYRLPAIPFRRWYW